MLVCLCNALSDRAIRAAVENGATCCREVWERCHCRPDCGHCGAAIKEILAAHGNSQPARAGHACPGQRTT